jgi:phosphomevalonate kinase
VTRAVSVRAPGKLFLTGAYAVLEGAPAVIVAVDRYAEARFPASGASSPMREVAAVARRLGAHAPSIDTSSLEEGGRKLGLGSSAAAAVAAAGAIVVANGDDLETARDRILEVALAAHADVQPRGSGGDVAAATYGGAVRVRRHDGRLQVEPLAPSPHLVLCAFAAKASARTSDALDRLAARRDRTTTRAALSSIAEAAHAGARSFGDADPTAFLEAAAAHVAGLERLGEALDLHLVPAEVGLARRLLQDGPVSEKNGPIVLLPSGAGGGDTVLWLGARAPTDHEALALEGLGLTALRLNLSPRGVHSVPLLETNVDADRI